MTLLNMFGPQPAVEPKPGETPHFYECEICGHLHPWAWDGDCRDDANRFTMEEVEQRYPSGNYVLSTMEERVEADAGTGVLA